VLGLLAEGLSNEQIAERLNTSWPSPGETRLALRRRSIITNPIGQAVPLP
jgi:hypothetical protein